MAEELNFAMELTATDAASPAIHQVQQSFAELQHQLQSLTKVIRKSFGEDLTRAISNATSITTKFTTDATAGMNRTTAAVRADVQALTDLAAAYRAAAAAQRGMNQGGGRGGAGGGRPPAPQRGAVADLRAIRQRWSLRERSARAETAEIASVQRAEANRARAALDAVAQRWKVRQASERAELRHLGAVKREQAAIRREAQHSFREAYRSGRHAVRSINHPALESPGHAAALGVAFGTAAMKSIVEHSVDLDTAATRYKMFAVPQGVNGAKATADAIKKAQLDSIQLGTSSSVILDIQSKAARDGIRADIAAQMPKMILSAGQIMGGDPEKLTDTLSEGVQQALSMHLVKDVAGVRRFINMEAGLATTAGNNAEKQEQFIRNGGLGHGRELGLNLTDTMAYGALLNSSGAGSGLVSSRFLGSLSQNVPKMRDDYIKASRSHGNTEQVRAIRSAPSLLGFGSIDEMQKELLSGPEGLIDFAQRLSKVNEKQRKLILEGYHFGEQGGAMLAEIGESPEKARAVLARAKQLAEQTEGNDYLSEKFAEWQTSLANMLKQIQAGWDAISNSMGDVLKTDLIAPFRDWWQDVSTAIVNSDLKDRVHRAIKSFFNGLGFDDMAAMLRSIKASVGDFDFAEFAKGLGEGIKASIDAVRSIFNTLGGGKKGISAETVGKLATEFFALSFALHLAAPIITTIGGIVAAFWALKSVLGGIKSFAKLFKLGEAVSSLAGVELGGIVSGLGGLVVALTAIGVVVQKLMDAGILNKVTLLPKSGSKDDVDEWLWGRDKTGKSQRPAWIDRLTGNAPATPAPVLPKGASNPTAETAQQYWAKKNKAIGKPILPEPPKLPPAPEVPKLDLPAMPMKDDGPSKNNWRSLLQPASYTSDAADDGSDSRSTAKPQTSWSPADQAAMAQMSTVVMAEDLHRVRDGIERLVQLAQLQMMRSVAGVRGSTGGFGGGDGDGFGPGTGRDNLRFGHHGAMGSGGTPNMRYGHGAVTPGSGTAHEIGPRVSLGKMGAKFAAKAPTIMDGLKKKYGLTDEQAAGVLGNLGHESAGFTAYHEGGQAPGRGGVGWAQWTGPRRHAFERWVASHGLNPTSDEASWRYLTEGDPETAGAIAAVKGQNTVEGSLRAFHDKFERSADISHGQIVKPKSWRSRQSFAAKALALSKQHPGGATVEDDKSKTDAKAPATPRTVSPETAGIARHVLGITRHKSDDTRPSNNMTTADNSSSTKHITFHISHPDHRQITHSVLSKLDMSPHYHDVGDTVA